MTTPRLRGGDVLDNLVVDSFFQAFIGIPAMLLVFGIMFGPFIAAIYICFFHDRIEKNKQIYNDAMAKYYKERFERGRTIHPQTSTDDG